VSQTQTKFKNGETKRINYKEATGYAICLPSGELQIFNMMPDGKIPCLLLYSDDWAAQSAMIEEFYGVDVFSISNKRRAALWEELLAQGYKIKRVTKIEYESVLVFAGS